MRSFLPVRALASVLCPLVGAVAFTFGAGHARAADPEPAPAPATAPDKAKDAPAPPPEDKTSADKQKDDKPKDTAGGAVPELAFERFTLDNGLDVILHQDARLPVACVDVWYHVGAFHEDAGRTGFAHLFEHLMFQGTPHVPGDSHFKLLEQAGASFTNGTTDFDRTNYFEVVPKNELELALWLESDRMGWLMQGVDQAKLDEQRKVVKNERRQSVENAPYGLADEKLWQAMFPPAHPYWGYVIGSMADLDSASLADVRAFYDTYYAPSNATLVIAGDIDTAQTKALVRKYFDTLPKWTKPAGKTVAPPALTQEVRVDAVDAVAQLPRVQVQYFTPPMFAPGAADLEVLAGVLVSLTSSSTGLRMT